MEQKKTLRRAAAHLAERLRTRFGARVAGPVAPPIDRIRGEYILRLMLKVENGRSLKRARELLREELHEEEKSADFKRIIISIDVDPQ